MRVASNPGLAPTTSQVRLHAPPISSALWPKPASNQTLTLAPALASGRRASGEGTARVQQPLLRPVIQAGSCS